MTRSRILLLVLAAGLLVSVASLWRAGDDPAALAPQRGGQIVASMRGEPRSYNRLADRTAQGDLLAWLMHAKLVRVNRATNELEPSLAERWESSADGRTHTLHLRTGVTWSDGMPFTSADVLFTVEALFDPKANVALASSLMVAGQPIRADAPDAATVVFTYPGPSGPGIRLLDNLWVLPKHKLEVAARQGTFTSAWSTSTPPSEVVGLGPFVLHEYQAGQRLVLDRNPRYWRTDENGTQLPYLDRIVIEIITDQNTELLRLTSGALDLTSSELRPEDYVIAKREADRGRLTLLDLGTGPDPDSFWFCLKPEAKRKDPRFAFVQRPEFRQAISHAVDRRQFADVVYLGAAIPLWGPVTPANTAWFWPGVPRYEHDVERARTLLRGIGLEDRNGNGIVEDRHGTEARFVVLTQRGISHYERATALLRDELANVGIALDVAPLELGTMIQRMVNAEYDAIYWRFLLTDFDPALTKDFWLSSGSAHVWNIGQRAPATDWERRIDTLLLEQAATSDPARRKELFNHVQRILAENLPILNFVAPRLYYAHSARLRGAQPAALRPNVLWQADTLNVTGPPGARGTN